MARLIQVHPVLNVRDVTMSAAWYQRLGFEPVFADSEHEPKYGGMRRDNVEIHLQWHDEQEWADGLDGSAYRFLVDDPDTLFETFPDDIVGARTVGDTDWGTREFGLYDPDGNAVFFYRDR